MIRVHAPIGTYSGLSAGALFVAGVAEVDETSAPAAVAYFRRAGYRIEQLETPARAPEVIDAGIPAATAGDPVAGDAGGDAAAPGPSAKKAEWVAYAETHGIPRDEAEDLTIKQLRERLGA